MDDTRHITKDQYGEIFLQLEGLIESWNILADDATNLKNEEIHKRLRTILDILCLDVADV